MKTRNSAFNAGILVLLLLFVAAGCKTGEDGADAYGNFEAEEIMLASRVGGELLKLNVNEGEQVSEGQIIGLVDTMELHLQKEQLIAQRASVLSGKPRIRAEVRVLRQQIANRRKDESRLEKMLKDGAIEQKKVDDVKGQISLFERQIEVLGANFGSINNQVDVIMAQVKIVDKKIRDCYLKAPVDGVILEKYAESGELIAPGKAIFKLSDISSLVLKVYISGDQLSQVEIGKKIDVLIDVPDDRYKTYQGKITWVSDKSEFTPKVIQTKQERVKFVYAMKVEVPNDGSLKIGMPGEVVISKQVEK